MKPTQITTILDLAKKAREKGLKYVPLFAGEAGLGKSEVCQAWVKKQQETNPDFFFLDLRIAYLEGPDFVGLPKVTLTKHGQERTSHILPEFWPTEGQGLVLIEEPNRGNSSVMNCLMQILTDRKIHNYTLPEGAIIASCINPDNTGYDVNSMDAALKNRFQIFDIKYDHKSFIEFMEKDGYHPNVINFVKSDIWQYKTSDELGEKGSYISPRSFSKLSTVELIGAAQTDTYFDNIVSVLGDHVGREYHKFTTEMTPVMAKDLVLDEKAALKKLKKYCNTDSYKGDLVNLTIESLGEHYGKEVEGKTIGEDLIVKVAMVIPKDQAVNLLEKVIVGKLEGQVKLKAFVEKHPDLKEALVTNLRGKKK